MTRNPFARLLPCLLLAGLLLAGAPVRAQMKLFQDPDMIKAVMSEDLARMKQLLVKGTGANATDGHGKSALAYATAAGSTEAMQLLLDYNANPDMADKLGNTPVHLAAEAGDVEALDTLIRNRAHVDKENRQGITPLMAAVRAGKLDAVRRLITAKASLDAHDYTGRTALSWAEEGRNPRIVQALRQAGAR